MCNSRIFNTTLRRKNTHTAKKLRNFPDAGFFVKSIPEPESSEKPTELPEERYDPVPEHAPSLIMLLLQAGHVVLS